MKEFAKFKIDRLFCKGENHRLSFGYKSVGLPWKLLKLYPTVHLYLFFSSHSIVLFPLRTPTTWGSAKCIRRLFKVWRNWPNSKMICYSERVEPRLSFGYKFVGLSLNSSKVIPNRTVIFLYFLHTVLYCYHWEHRQLEGVLSVYKGSLRYEEIGQIQNW